MKLNRKEFFSTLAGSAMGILGVKAKEPQIKVPEIVVEPYVELPIRKIDLTIREGGFLYSGVYCVTGHYNYNPDDNMYLRYNKEKSGKI